MRIAVLGTGVMGAGIAGSLARNGHDVTVWNRTAEKAEALAGNGVTVGTTVAGAVAGAEAVVTMLFDVTSVLEVVPEMLGALAPDALWVQGSTVGTGGTARLVEAAGHAADRFLDAPVLGTRKPAEDGTLVVLVSGPEAARERARPVFEAIGSRTLVVGDRPGGASALKLAANSWVASITAATAQAMGLAEALGLDPDLFLQAIQGTAVDSAYAHLKGATMASRDWEVPAFALDGVRKDIELMREAALDSGCPDDLLAALLAVYDRASGEGHGGHDMAAVRAAFDR